MTYLTIAGEVARRTNAGDHGVVISVSTGTADTSFVIWTVKQNRLIRHKLDAASTSPERLLAHIQGFIDNLK